MYHSILKCEVILIIEQSPESAHFLFTFLWDNNTSWEKKAWALHQIANWCYRNNDVPLCLAVIAHCKP